MRRNAYALYIDNYACLNVDATEAEHEVQRMRDTLAEVGIVSDDEEVQAERDVFLGFELEVQAASWRPAPKRMCKILGGLDFALRPRAFVTGAEIERLPGHLLSAMLLRRELLPIFGHVWKFINETYLRRVPLWQSVHRELRHARAPLPLAVAHGRQRWPLMC